MGRDGDRDLVVEKFEKWLTTGESFGNIYALEEKRQSIPRKKTIGNKQ